MVRKDLLRFSIILLFFLIGVNAQGQERRVLKGQVLVDSLRDLQGIHIVNLTAETGTITNEFGQFEILARVGDSLFFSSVQYEYKKVAIRKSSFETNFSVSLRERLNELDEIKIDDIRLSGSLTHDIEKVPKSIYTKLGWGFPKAPQTSLEMAIQSSGNSGGNPIGFLLNTINGKIRELKKAEENNQKMLIVEKAFRLLGKNYFQTIINIPENEIQNILFFNADKPEFRVLVMEKDLLAIMELMEQSLSEFLLVRKLK